MEYDAMIFGNGLTLNLLSQLKAYIPLENHYLLAFDTFMASFINEQLPADLDHKIFFALYTQNSIANQKHYAEMKSIFRTYYHYCDGNIEKYFGLAEFQRNNSFNYSAVKTYMPFFYNIWFCILDSTGPRNHRQIHSKHRPAGSPCRSPHRWCNTCHSNSDTGVCYRRRHCRPSRSVPRTADSVRFLSVNSLCKAVYRQIPSTPIPGAVCRKHCKLSFLLSK